jgi:hypothetical protein
MSRRSCAGKGDAAGLQRITIHKRILGTWAASIKVNATPSARGNSLSPQKPDFLDPRIDQLIANQ